ncbi:MAG: S8 family serine peptidase [Pseudomonadota bacterium]
MTDEGLPEGSHIDVWSLRDEEFPGFDNDARQSRLTDPACPATDPIFQREPKIPCDCPVKPEGTLNVLSDGAQSVTVGGYVAESGKMARYSSGGRTNDAPHPGPDVSAVSDDSRVHTGVLSAAVLSGGKAALNGTSVAAPQITKWLAERMAAGEPGTRDTAKAKAETCETSGIFEGRAPQPDVFRSGAGRIELHPQSGRRYQPR